MSDVQPPVGFPGPPPVESIQSMFAQVEAEQAALKAAAGGVDYTVYVRPARWGWVARVDTYEGALGSLLHAPSYWRPTAAMARAAALRKAGRWNRAADRRRCETEVGRR